MPDHVHLLRDEVLHRRRVDHRLAVTGAEEELLTAPGSIAAVGQRQVRALEQLTCGGDVSRRIANELEQVERVLLQRPAPLSA